VVIETDLLHALCEVAEAAGAAAKSSGAGGGDCGLTLAPAGADISTIEAGWREQGIVPLPLAVAPQRSRHAPQSRHAPRPNHRSDNPAQGGNPMTSVRSARKNEHVQLVMESRREQPNPTSDFDDGELVHHALDGIDPARVDLAADVGPWRWAAPLLISGMTGGSESTGRINRALAIAARETGTPIASGSMSVVLDEPDTLPTFRVLRDENPDGIVLANLGAERSPDDARRVVDLLGADGLQVHVNAAQETVMPEGSHGFDRWAGNIEAIVDAVEVPVLVKEVGSGLSGRTLSRLHSLGVRLADVAGRGGTDFAAVENARRAGRDYAYLAGWGQSAVCCLLDVPDPAPQVIASGGVRHPLDVVRALALGARAVSVAGAFLAVAVDGDEAATVAELRRWREHLTAIHALVGAPSPADLTATDVLLHGRVLEFARLRGIDAGALARRSR
jgi:isopentenyl-diphosphate delta-isomerase